MKKIDDEMISKIEQVFGFPLNDWQKEFIKSVSSVHEESSTKPPYVIFPRGGRTNGRMLALSLGLLLGDLKEPLDLNDLGIFTAECVLAVNEKLVAAGIKTNLITEKEKKS